ncbi:aldo-keto reductase [Exophiala viscosa]|uniref:Aldo-keto reductase n=1 Tax=Exophiala viscosa TaxID=2486360 RepID=A0AAN6DMA3_9EURO|nr:aldo-keto reductase [Exophiala viscosa]KAI1620776.1 aldo-keto reductase [Exophiala viscosa]
MDKILQTGLSAGMSATEGIHSSKPPNVPADHDGLKFLLPDSFVPSAETRLTFKGKGGNDVEVPTIFWGAWSWGDPSTWHWKDEEIHGVRAAWKKCLEGGMTFIDTAQAYGDGRSEEITGDLIRNHSGGVPREKIQVQTKWLANVTDGKLGNILHPIDAPLKALKKSLDRMKLDYIDCYLVHGHVHVSSISQVAKGLAKCVDEGLTKTVGVANYSVEDMLEMKDALAKYNIPLATNQCEYSILRRLPETEGMLDACRQHGIVFQSYSSLAQGRLTGKYTKDHPPPKTYRFSSYPMEYIEPLHNVMRQIAQRRGVSMSAVALNYNISKGVVPTVGIRKEEQAVEDMQALGWRLTREEVAELDKNGYEGKSTKLWQQG